MAGSRRPHWRAPTTIIAALMCAIIFALGHHLFYQYLDGSSASSDVYDILGSNVSVQQLNIAVGTAFALLFKTSLDVALSSVFIQLVWRALSAKSDASTIRLDALDAIFDVLTNIFALFEARVWWRYPLLFLLATTAWYVETARAHYCPI